MRRVGQCARVRVCACARARVRVCVCACARVRVRVCACACVRVRGAHTVNRVRSLIQLIEFAASYS